jgi:hypothetical protein
MPDEEQPDYGDPIGPVLLRLCARSSAGAREPCMSGVSSQRMCRIAFDGRLMWRFAAVFLAQGYVCLSTSYGSG